MARWRKMAFIVKVVRAKDNVRGSGVRVMFALFNWHLKAHSSDDARLVFAATRAILKLAAAARLGTRRGPLSSRQAGPGGLVFS